MTLTAESATAFAYGDGVGVVSIPAIEALEAKSGIAMTMTNGNPPGSGAFHGTGNACDFSNGGDAGTPEMDALATYFLGFAPYLLELIHVNQDGTGTYVKYGSVVDSSFYASVLFQHHNHVHIAATNHGIMAAIAGGPAAGKSATLTAANASFNAQDVLSLNPLSGVASLYNFVTDPHNWIRLAEFIAGAFLLFLSIKALAESGKG